MEKEARFGSIINTPMKDNNLFDAKEAYTHNHNLTTIDLFR